MGRLLLLALLPLALFAGKNLEAYFIDVEGGGATLFVAPGGQTLLVDAGWPGAEARDAKRILAAMKKAGARQIDHLVVTHHHQDHVGGVLPLAERTRIAAFYDHGPSVETGRQADLLRQDYERALGGATPRVLKPGDRVPVKGLDVQVLAANGEVISQPGSQNPHCAGVEPKADAPGENTRSIGMLVTFGKFRLLHLGDLTWNPQLELACPANRIGTVDAFVVTHHGNAASNPAALVHAVAPRVAIVNNGARKGGAAAAWKTVRSAPRLEDIWQLHYAYAAGKEANAPDAFVANLIEDGCAGNYIKLEAAADGSFTVTNSRQGYAKSYR